MHAARIALVVTALVLVALEVWTAAAEGRDVNLSLVAAMGLLIVSMAVSVWEARQRDRSA